MKSIWKFLRDRDYREFLKWDSDEERLLETKYGFVMSNLDSDAVLFLDNATIKIEKKMNIYRDGRHTIHYNVIIDDHNDPTGYFEDILYSLEELNDLIKRTISMF